MCIRDRNSGGGVSLSGSTNNTVATVTGANALIGEGNLTFDGSTLGIAAGSSDNKIQIDGTSPYIQFRQGTTNKAYIQWSSGGDYVQLGNEQESTVIRIASGETGLIYRVGTNNRTLWTSGNDGASSGLDSDLLDGQEGSHYTNAANLTGTLPAIDGSNLTGISGSIAGISTTGTSNFANIQLIGITTGLNVSGVLTAAQFSGDGANLTSLPAAQLSGTAAAINGSNITNLTSGNLTGALPAISGASLTNVPAADPTDSDIQVAYTVTANGSSAYRFAGNGVVSTADDPDIFLTRGVKYRFINNSGGSHPFQIRVSDGGSAYSTGVTNNGASSGNIDFAPTYDSPAQLVYQCTSHSGMVGNIYLRDAAGGNTNVGVTTFTDTLEVKGSSGGTLKVTGSAAHTSKIVVADNGGTGNGNCLVEGGDGSDFFTIQSNGNVNFASGNGITFADSSTSQVLDLSLIHISEPTRPY